MEIQVNLGERKRKELAQAVGGVVGAEPIYKGAPTYAYEVGAITIGRDASLIFPNEVETGLVDTLLDALRAQGFHIGFEDDYTEIPFQTVLQFPLDGFTEATLGNLRLLTASKAGLIRKAFGVRHLPIVKAEETVDFPWFDTELPPEEVNAYTHFICLLCDMAKRQSRVLATEKPVENEKYAFRCFLLRLGMIGEQYAETRRILLRNLSGNGSMKSGERKAPKEKEPPGESNPESTQPEAPKKGILKKALGGLKTLFTT